MGCGCIGGSPEKDYLKSVCRGKTEEQTKVIEYFVKTPGCFSSNISDEDYMKIVYKKRDSLNLRAKAISKIGLDEDEINEIPPAMFEGFVYKDAYAKKTATGRWVSSAYEVTWLFFSSTQVYVYSYTFFLDEDRKKEKTDEYFYKDVTSFSTSSEEETARTTGDKEIKVESNKFCMVVPGERFTVSMNNVANSEAIIQAMKQKLREKKMQ